MPLGGKLEGAYWRTSTQDSEAQAFLALLPSISRILSLSLSLCCSRSLLFYRSEISTLVCSKVVYLGTTMADEYDW